MSTEKNATKSPRKDQDIGDYTISKTIGEGTFGKVKLGYHKITGEKVAIKILEKSRIIDVADIERVSREIHILKLIRHPNIIQLYEVNATQIIEAPARLYLIMEYASSGELFDYIVAQTRIKEAEACKFFKQLIAGIEYIHKLNVVHRDLKPENLLLDHNHDIKIVDFGLSNTYNKNELLKTACGSPCYAAPEMIAGKEYSGYKVDIWSAGIILFAMICGYLPFEDPKTGKLYKKILKGVYTTPNYISDSAKDLIKGILRTDPDQRFSMEEIKNHEWLHQVHLEISPGILVGYQTIPVDQIILGKLEGYKIDKDYAQKCIEANKHNNVSTGYYLLLKKHLRDGGTSLAHYSHSSDVDTPKPRSHSKTYSINTSQEIIPLYRLSHDKIFTPGPRKLFEYTQSPRAGASSKHARPYHGRNLSQIVETVPSPKGLNYSIEGKRAKRSSNAITTPRPPSRELLKFARGPKESDRAREKIDSRKETFLNGRPTIHLRSLTAHEENNILKPIKVRRELYLK
jgi:5'-AMP-activated protein kinase, catalytic alpha subunit